MSIVGDGIIITSRKLLKFYVSLNGNQSDIDTYFFEEGMTFDEWVSSQYNVAECHTRGSCFEKTIASSFLVVENYLTSDMAVVDAIIPEHCYNVEN